MIGRRGGRSRIRVLGARDQPRQPSITAQYGPRTYHFYPYPKKNSFRILEIFECHEDNFIQRKMSPSQIPFLYRKNSAFGVRLCVSGENPVDVNLIVKRCYIL